MIPVNPALPVISGTPTLGMSLLVTVGLWSNGPTSYAVAWRRDGGATVGTGFGYVPIAADVGHYLDCLVTATNADGTSLALASTPTPTIGPFTNLFTAPSLTDVSPGWQGYGLRVVLDKSTLAAGPASGLLRVTFSLTSGTLAGTLDAAFVGPQTSGAIFDVTPTQLLFGGNPVKGFLNGATVFANDPVQYSYSNASNMMIAMHYSGTEVGASSLVSGSAPTTVYYRGADPISDTGLLAPANTFTGPHNEIDFIASVDIF